RRYLSSALCGSSPFHFRLMLVPLFFDTGPPELSIPVDDDGVPSASISVTTARRLSVTNGTVSDESTAAGSRPNRARTWKYRAGGLLTSEAAVRGALHALHVSSGSDVLPVRVENSSGPLETQ